MNTSVIEGLLMTLLSAAVCICLPKVVSLLWSKYTHWRSTSGTQVQSNLDLSASNIYSAFTQENPTSFPEV
ncbi:hypothetical protein [Allocoleopsis sp.]|uniref:hypothetical protein n=1 Tax=Allocoleopsis sp. TaxID=3088169 RepID=UPI002FCF8871